MKSATAAWYLVKVVKRNSCFLLFTKFHYNTKNQQQMNKTELQEKEGVMNMKPIPRQVLPSPLLPCWTSATRQHKAAASSITREEIRRFWIQRKMEEEEHLLAAEKAAARIKARALTKEDHARFEDLLKITVDNDDESIKNDNEGKDNNKELRIGIKDWWTKSKYAYLNQPAIKTMEDTCRIRNTYIPNSHFFHVPLPHLPKSALGVF